MTSPRPERDDGVDERLLRTDGGRSLRQLLGSSSTDDLAALVEQFWTDQNYRTTRRERGGQLFVLAQSSDGDDRHLVWVDADASATPDRVETLVGLAETVGADEATVISGREYGPEVYTAVDEHGVECLAEEQLLTFVHRAGLEPFVRRRHASGRAPDGSRDGANSPAPTNAVADGGATETARDVVLSPRADHPTTLRAALVVGGGVLTLLSVWGGAAQVTNKLQTCGSGCSLVWLLSFLPLAAMVLGSFAVAVGVFD